MAEFSNWLAQTDKLKGGPSQQLARTDNLRPAKPTPVPQKATTNTTEFNNETPQFIGVWNFFKNSYAHNYGDWSDVEKIIQRPEGKWVAELLEEIKDKIRTMGKLPQHGEWLTKLASKMSRLLPNKYKPKPPPPVFQEPPPKPNVLDGITNQVKSLTARVDALERLVAGKN